MSFTSTRDPYLEMRFGNHAGRESTSAIGHSDSVGTNLRFLHHEHNTADLDIHALIDTPSTVKIASTSANDTSAGTGARTVRILGFDSAGDELIEDVTMNGSTEVTTTGTFKFICGAQVLTAGTSQWNEGVLWIGNGTFTAGVPVTKYMSVEVNVNLAAGGSCFVPNGKTFWPTALTVIASDTSKNTNIQFELYDGSLKTEIFDIHFTGQAIVNFDIRGFKSIAANTLVGLKANVDTGTAIITTMLEGVWKDD